MPRKRSIVLMTAGVFALTATACRPPAETAGTVSPPPAAPAVRTSAGDAAPVSERDLARKRAFEDAIRGLRFEGERVIVDDRLPGSDEDARTLFQAGRDLHETNQRTAAIKSYARAVRTAPDRPDLYVGLGDAFITKGRTDLAVAAYRTAAELDPTNPEPLSRLALTLSREGRAGEAIRTMHALLAVDPDHAVAHERLAIWHYYDGDDVAAWRHVQETRRVGHDVP
ncbi:MAG: tetratricopeptide repeat protein, partial [Phycisphaerae bacterium]|nr:tetratricopeptide repeat protein [Phycisphaerae bacterium]